MSLHTRNMGTWMPSAWALYSACTPSAPQWAYAQLVLIQYVLFWVEYNSKYHKDEITLQPPPHKRIWFMSYKYTMNPSSQRFTISLFSIFLAHIFSEFISLKYHRIFFLHIAIDFTIKESSHLSKITFCMHRPWSSELSVTTCYYHSYWLPALPNITYHYLQIL